MKLTEDEIHAIRVTMTCSSTASIIGCLFVCVNYFAFPSIRTLTSTLIAMLSITALVSAFMNLIVWGNDIEGVCVFQGIGMQIFDVSSFLWTSCIAFHAFQIIYRKQRESSLWSFFKYYVAFCYGVPIVLAIIPFIVYQENVYHQGAVWCWISDNKSVLRLVLYYVPLILLWMFNLVIYVLLRTEMRRILSFMMGKASRRISMYILIFIICKFPGLINRIYSVISENDQVFWLFLLQALVSPLQGFINSIVYGMNKTLRKEYSQLGCGWCHTRDVAAGNEANDNSDQEESSEAIPNVTLLTSNYRAYT